MKYRTPASRPAFTLIELMVAAALSLVIMTIMALAFQSAMATLSNLKSTGDQADRLRTAEVMLRADLEADHIMVDDNGGSVRISDVRFDQPPPPPLVKGGYFILTTGSIVEGYDSEVPSPGIPSTRMSSATANSLTMTVRRNSKTSADLFGFTKLVTNPHAVTDTLGTTTDATHWAEVKWQLGTKHTIGNVDMWPLHRIVRPIIGTPPLVPTTVANGFAPASGTALGDDIVLTNVISFEVKPLLISNGVVSFPGQDAPYSERLPTWDTGPSQSIRCVSVLVKIRLYDVKTKLTRQMSLIAKP